jgi:hypothetical protein
VLPAGALPKPNADQGKLPKPPPLPALFGISSSSGVAVVPVQLLYVRAAS